MFLIQLVIVVYLLCLIYIMIVSVVIEFLPLAALLFTAPHTLTSQVIRWLQNRVYQQQTEKQMVWREVISRAVSLGVYVLVALHFEFSTGWTIFAAFVGVTASRLD